MRAAVAPAGIIFMPAGASLSWMVVVEGDFGCCCWMTAAAVGRDLDVATEAADITWGKGKILVERFGRYKNSKILRSSDVAAAGISYD